MTAAADVICGRILSRQRGGKYQLRTDLQGCRSIVFIFRSHHLAMLHPELAEALQRREDELRRKERRRSNLLIGGSIAVNAIISLLLVTAAIASQNAAPLKGSRTVEDAPSYDFMARAHSRKLQQVMYVFDLSQGLSLAQRGKGAEGSFMAAVAATAATLIPLACRS